MFEFELGIPSLIQGIQIDSVAFKNVKELSSLSTLVFLIMIEMLIHSTE